MATITKTFTENIGNTPYSTWTLTASGINAVASKPTFEFTAPVVTAKFVNSQRKFALVRINDLLTLADGTIIIGFTHDRGGGVEDPMPTNSGTQYTLSSDPDKRTSITSRIFNTNNPRERVVNVHFKQRTVTLETRTTETTGVSRYYSSEQIDWGVVATITLDAPPTYTLSALSKDTSDYYANLTTVSVTISSATAQYGGDISISSLTIGSQTVTGSGNGTLSMRLNNAGTFTPTVIVTDSRGQSTTKTLETITVQPYLVPSVTFDVYRTNDTGIKNDEGHYALIQSTISYTDAIATLIEPSIQIDGVDLSSLTDASVTWYTTWSNTSGVSNVISDWTTLVPQNHMVTIYGLIDWDYDTTGNFAEDTSYQITLVANDSVNGHSTPITQTMSTAFYTIDFQAGGKEIAFGAPANDNLASYPNGLFKCEMDIGGRGFLDYIYPIGSIYQTIDDGFNPNIRWGGTWELIEEGRFLQATETSATGGDTVSAGLPNIGGHLDIRATDYNASKVAWEDGVFIKSTTAGYTADAVHQQNGAVNVIRYNFDAHYYNSIYGNSTTVQPSAVKVYMWHRTA